MRSDRTTKAVGAPEGDDSERRARARVNAWLLALLVLAFYIGFIAIGAFKSFAG